MNDSEQPHMSEPFQSADNTDQLINAASEPAEAIGYHEALVNLINALPEEVQKHIKDYMRVTKVTPSEYEQPEIMLPAEEALAKLTHASDGVYGAPDASLPKEGELNVENLDQGKFAVLFGRDGLLISELLRELFPEIEEQAVDKLAEFQAVEADPAAEKEFGKILHELRFENDPIAIKLAEERGWKMPYYGAVDSTPKFISAMSKIAKKKEAAGENYLGQTIIRYEDKEETSRRKSLDNALQWLTANQDLPGNDGLITFQRQIPKGIENQILRDSGDSMSDKSGRLANHDRPIAALQAQVDAYDAFIDAAELFENQAEATGDAVLAERAADYRRRAQHLHDQVIEQFYIEDERGGYFAVGLDQDEDGKFHPLDTRTNDMAFLLSSKMLKNDGDRDKVEQLVATLSSDEMKVGGGLRSLSKNEVNFLPGGYHNGSDWLVVDAKYAEGLLQHGFVDQAIAVYEWIIKACDDAKAYPEYLMGGDSRDPEINTLKVEVSTSSTSNTEDTNTLMQPPEMGQGWTIAAYILAKHRLQQLSAERIPANELEEDELVA